MGVTLSCDTRRGRTSISRGVRRMQRGGGDGDGFGAEGEKDGLV